MRRRVSQLLLLAAVLTLLVVVLFRLLYRDYLLIHGYYSSETAGTLRPGDVNAERLDEVYRRTLQEVSPDRDFSLKKAVMLHEILWRTDRGEQALELASRLVEARQRNLGLRIMYADRLAEMGHTEEAEEQYQYALSLMKEG